MDHRWDESKRQDRAARGEHQRYGASRIENDPDVDRRDRIREIERLRSINQSPWAIGVSHWNQRDTYTRNASMGEDGYGHGPAMHPQEGSYAYPREFRHQLVETNIPALHDFHGHELEAPHHDSFWEKLKGGVADIFHGRISDHVGKGPKNARPDQRIHDDVCDALTFRGDLDATDIEVTVKGGEVTLEGTVTDRREKRVAEQVCEGIVGVEDVHNRLTIRKDDPTDANVAFVLPVGLLGAL